MFESPDYADRSVLDRDGQQIGKVTDVVSDPITLEAEWLVVKLGRFAGEHLVPLAAVDERADGLAVRLPKQEIKSTPKVHDHLQPTARERDALYRHYGLVT